jgi:hypothetical protein
MGATMLDRIRRLWEPDEVLVCDSWIPRASLPRVLTNYMQSAHEAQREAKANHLRAVKAERERDELQALLTEMKKA